MLYVIKWVGGIYEGMLNKKLGDIFERGSFLVFFFILVKFILNLNFN